MQFDSTFVTVNIYSQHHQNAIKAISMDSEHGICICSSCKPGRHLTYRVIFNHVQRDRTNGLLEDWHNNYFPNLESERTVLDMRPVSITVVGFWFINTFVVVTVNILFVHLYNLCENSHFMKNRRAFNYTLACKIMKNYTVPV